MSTVAKVVIIDNNGRYLLMKRSDHPAFGSDADIPGGTLDNDETPQDTAIREVFEEAGITLDANTMREVYIGKEYSTHDTLYVLYVAHVQGRPEVQISWEHSSYEWVSREDFLKQAKSAVDSYMHMVYAVMASDSK